MTQESEQVQPKRGFGNLRIVWRFAKNYPWQILAAFSALVVAAMATLAIPVGFQLVIDEGFGGGNGATPIRSPLIAILRDVLGPFLGTGIDFWFKLLLATVIVLALATATRFYFVSWMGERVIADFRKAVQDNLVTLSPSYFEVNRPAEIASRLTADTSVIEQVVGTTVSVALRNLFIAIGGLVVLVIIAPKLAGMLLLGIPVITLPFVFLGRKLEALSKQSQDRIASVGTVASETLGSMKIVQAFGQEKREAARFAAAVEHTFATARRRIKLRAFMTAAFISMIFIAVTLVIWQATVDVKTGKLSAGDLFAFVGIGALVTGAFGALVEVVGDLLRGSAAAARLAQLMEERPIIAVPAQPVKLPEPAKGAVAFSKVEFRYPTRPDTAALHDFTLNVLPGETVAVVGPSGAGKTTLFQLLERFYDPQAGLVSIDGVALPLADPADIRNRIALVPQDTVIFAASARDNLRYGRWDATDEELWTAADAANASDFLRALPQGLDTFMGEGGARLSGGQRQRVAIARALLRDAPILLLDEATSALDAESERLVQDALDRLMQNRTTIVIAHRLATVRSADRIIVMNEGRIVEEGKHSTLIKKKDGLYARLASLQFDAG